MKKEATNTQLAKAFNSLLTAMRDISTAKGMTHCGEKKGLVEKVRREVGLAKYILDSL